MADCALLVASASCPSSTAVLLFPPGTTQRSLTVHVYLSPGAGEGGAPWRRTLPRTLFVVRGGLRVGVDALTSGVWVSAEADGRRWQGGPAIELHRWYRLALRWRLSTVDVFVDGSLLTAVSCTGETQRAVTVCVAPDGGVHGLFRFATQDSDESLADSYFPSSTAPPPYFGPFQPLTSCAQLLAWTPDDGEDCARLGGHFGAVQLRDSKAHAKPMRVLHCHDMKGGYLPSDAQLSIVRGTDEDDEEAWKNAYCFANWSLIDVFVYFSHERVTVPPPGWIRAGHAHRVLVLGTLMTEWEAGEQDNLQLLECAADGTYPLADRLAALAVHYGFDGWFVNIEAKLPSGRQAAQLVRFVAYLTGRVHAALGGGGLVLWYDSVTDDGAVRWQNCLNDRNRAFFDACDGIFLNYQWTDAALSHSLQLATPARQRDVYAGVDVFGRGTYGGGGFSTWRALAAIARCGLSAGLFAPAWTLEQAASWSAYQARERKFWRGAADVELDGAVWSTTRQGGQGWLCTPQGTFVASHDWCARSCCLDLAPHDSVHSVHVEVAYRGTGPNTADLFRLTATLCAQDASTPLAAVDTGVLTATADWQTAAVALEAVTGGRWLRLSYEGKDAEHWHGHYGVEVGRVDVRLQLMAERAAELKRQCVATYSRSRPVGPAALPFCSHFSLGGGRQLRADGRLVSARQWCSPSAQSVLPSYLDILVGLTGTTTVAVDDTDAWRGGNSLRITATAPVTLPLPLFDLDMSTAGRSLSVRLLVKQCGVHVGVAVYASQGRARKAPLCLLPASLPADLPAALAAAYRVDASVDCLLPSAVTAAGQGWQSLLFHVDAARLPSAHIHHVDLIVVNRSSSSSSSVNIGELAVFAAESDDNDDDDEEKVLARAMQLSLGADTCPYTVRECWLVESVELGRPVRNLCIELLPGSPDVQYFDCYNGDDWLGRSFLRSLKIQRFAGQLHELRLAAVDWSGRLLAGVAHQSSSSSSSQ